jgi:tRNA threonylcarbamoyladenosine biosynthesis protein TsaB
MKILAVDTATQSCSVAIVQNGAVSAEVTLVRRQTHSKHLMEVIESVVSFAEITLSDLDGFAVTRGPGSFTGLRIGLGTVKGLAAASGKPIVGVSSLSCLATQSCVSSYLICPIMDARKGEVYWAGYRYADNQLNQCCPEQVTPPENVLADIVEPCLFVGDGARLYQELIELRLGQFAHFAPDDQSIIRGATVAFLSQERFKSGNIDDTAGLTPCYIRRSDAEIKVAKNRQF